MRMQYTGDTMTPTAKPRKKNSKSIRSETRASRRARRSSSSSAAERNESNLPADDDDDDDRSASTSSTASTFSAIQSILERRRRTVRPPPAVEGSDDEGGTAEIVFGPPRPNDNSRPDERRKCKRKSSSHDHFKFHPLILLVLVSLASNWMATRVLNSILGGEIDADYTDAEMNANTEEKRDPLRNSWAEPSTKTSRRNLMVRGGSGNIQSHSFQQSQGIHASNNAAEPNDQQPILVPTQKADNALTGLVHADEKVGGQSSSSTKRFASMRRRLLSLYSEDVPPTPNSSHAPLFHPLYYSETPQYRALDWLANVDGFRLRHDNPGLVQRYVLAVMYFSTGGPPVATDTDLSLKRRGPWRNPTNFLAPTHECEWRSRIMDGAGRGGGIRRCDRNKTVVEISLYNELTGSIPSELGRLWNLRTLYLGRNRLTGTIPTELGMMQKLSSLSLQWNDLSGTVPEEYPKNLLTLRALQVEGNEKLTGEIERHSLLCQMRNKYRGPTPRDQEKYRGRRVLRILTATCVPPGSSVGVSDRLKCACCTECFGKTQKDLIYQE